MLATGHELNEEKFQIWTQALKAKHVLVLYMALRNIVRITDRLKEELGASFPVTAIYKASLIDQKIIDSDLEHISQELINQNFKSPVILYFGEKLNHLNNSVSACNMVREQGLLMTKNRSLLSVNEDFES
jgi:siroheme synthase